MSSKVARLIESDDLSGMGETLEKEWTGVEDSRTSLRDLADQFNKRLLKARLESAGAIFSELEVSSTYDLLQGEGSKADQTRKSRELERMGIDIDQLKADFVTHQAIYTYLTKYREVTFPEKKSDPIETGITKLERLQGRVEVVADSTIESSINANQMTLRDYNVIVDIQVVCGNCGSTYSIFSVLKRGGCDCSTE